MVTSCVAHRSRGRPLELEFLSQLLSQHKPRDISGTLQTLPDYLGLPGSASEYLPAEHQIPLQHAGVLDLHVYPLASTVAQQIMDSLPFRRHSNSTNPRDQTCRPEPSDHHVAPEQSTSAIPRQICSRTCWPQSAKHQASSKLSFWGFTSSSRRGSAPDNIILSVTGTKPPTLAELTVCFAPHHEAERSLLIAALDISRAAFLQQQPALYKLAVRVVKHWARHCDTGAPYFRYEIAGMCHGASG